MEEPKIELNVANDFEEGLVEVTVNGIPDDYAPALEPLVISLCPLKAIFTAQLMLEKALNILQIEEENDGPTEGSS